MSKASALQRLFAKFAVSDETATAVLKIHLLIEEALDGIIAKAVSKSAPLAQVRLSFVQKLFLVQALSPRVGDVKVWDFIKELNSLRNELVHSLKPANRARKLANLVDIYHRDAPADGTVLDLRGFPQEHALAVAALGVLGYLTDIKEEIGRAKHKRLGAN